LAPIAPGGSYPDSLKKPLENPRAGREETGRFLLLQQGTDYDLHPETGISLSRHH